jgi:hypothetical protein
MQVRPEVNLIVGLCTNEVNAVQCRKGQILPETPVSKKPIPTRILLSDICIGRRGWAASSLKHPSLGIEPLDTAGTPRSPPMAEINVTERKRPGRVTISQDEKLLVGRHEAAEMLSISRRALDYLVTNKQIAVRHIGSRVLIQVADLRRFSRGDHPQRLAG